jgi:hypothetical protein
VVVGFKGNKMGATVTDQNLIQEEIKRSLNSGNACYHSVQNLLSSYLLFENVNIGIYKTIWIFGPKRDEVTGEWRKLHNEDSYSSPSIFRIMKLSRMRWAGM